MSKLELTLAEVADLVGADHVVGDGEFVCRSVAALESAGPDQLSFVRDRRYEARARASKAGALIVPEELDGIDARQLVVQDPDLAFSKVLAYIAAAKRTMGTGIDSAAIVDESAALGSDVSIAAGAVVSAGAKIGDRVRLGANVFVGERCEIGDDCVLHANAVIMEDTVIGRRVTVLPGAVIGAEGFGIVRHEGRNVEIPQVGNVVIGDDVRIGACATVDRATFESTIVGRGTKIGDFAHVGHNCVIGEEVLLLPLAAIGGSSRVGDRAIFAARAACRDNITVGADAQIGAASSVFSDVDAGETVWGSPARPKDLEMKIQAALGRLPDFRRQLRRLGKKLR